MNNKNIRISKDKLWFWIATILIFLFVIINLTIYTIEKYSCIG